MCASVPFFSLNYTFYFDRAIDSHRVVGNSRNPRYHLLSVPSGFHCEKQSRASQQDISINTVDPEPFQHRSVPVLLATTLPFPPAFKPPLNLRNHKPFIFIISSSRECYLSGLLVYNT